MAMPRPAKSRPARKRRLLTLLALPIPTLFGCAGPAPVTDSGVLASETGLVEFNEASYEEAFRAVRGVLGDYRFSINRIDAVRGIITTHPKRTAGLASPWDREQSSMPQEWEDLANQQQRVVRVSFEGSDGHPGETPGEVVRAVVEVQLQRVHRPYWRIETESIPLSTHARARDTLGEQLPATFIEVLGLDTALADRLALAIEERLRLAPRSEPNEP